MNISRGIGAAILVTFLLSSSAVVADRLNVLLLTVDNMNWDSVGAYGCKVPDITPNIDRLARQGMRFRHGHVTIAICQPTRAVWMTGQYPHNSGALGFDPINAEVPTLVEALHDAGYYTGILAKTRHVVPSCASAFDESIPGKLLRKGRDSDKCHQFTKAFLANSAKNKKPFFLMGNAKDPHRPFAGSADEGGGGIVGTSRTYRPDEVVVPGFLPDIPEVRKELAEYFTSVHRADEVVGAVLRAVDEAGVAENTIVLFLSDHGMALPFAKTNVWYNSTRTPWIVRWPSVVQADSWDEDHFISGVDVAPTILEALRLPPLKKTDGRSFIPVLRGKAQSGREHVVTHINTVFSKRSYMMRGIQNAKFGYIYNG